jgi:hypothetical protein
MAFNDKSLIVKIDEIDSLSAEINNDFDFGQCPLIHNSSMIEGADERFGVLIVFFDEVVDRLRRFVVVVFALPIAVFTAGTVDEELVA